MTFPEQKALDIATQIVVSKVSNSNGNTDKDAGVRTGEYFEAIYNAVKEICISIY